MGGDNDSTGAIAGALHGALYGFDGIQPRNYEGGEFGIELLESAISLFRQRGRDEHAS